MSTIDYDSDGERPSASALLADALKRSKRVITRKERKQPTKNGKAVVSTPSSLWFDDQTAVPAISDCGTASGPSGSDADFDDE